MSNSIAKDSAELGQRSAEIIRGEREPGFYEAAGYLANPIPMSRLDVFAGKSHVHRAFIEDLDFASRTSSPVLLRGETGSGKSHAAFYIHSESDRVLRPFITLNCKTPMIADRFETELFGKEQSGYAVSPGKKNGLIEKAGDGTLFLDEVGDMSLEAQGIILNMLETGEFRRVGGKWTRYVQARIICATNRDLPTLVKQGKFLPTLYSRVARLIIRVPSLRERLGDINFLAQELLDEIGRRNRREYRIDPQAIACLQRYEYPGNIGELKNILLRALSCSTYGAVGVDELRKSCEFFSDACNVPEVSEHYVEAGASLYDSVIRRIIMTLRQFDGNRSSAARALGISERTLYRKLKKYGIE